LKGEGENYAGGAGGKDFGLLEGSYFHFAMIFIAGGGESFQAKKKKDVGGITFFHGRERMKRGLNVNIEGAEASKQNQGFTKMRAASDDRHFEV